MPVLAWSKSVSNEIRGNGRANDSDWMLNDADASINKSEVDGNAFNLRNQINKDQIIMRKTLSLSFVALKQRQTRKSFDNLIRYFRVIRRVGALNEAKLFSALTCLLCVCLCFCEWGQRYNAMKDCEKKTSSINNMKSVVQNVSHCLSGFA